MPSDNSGPWYESGWATWEGTAQGWGKYLIALLFLGMSVTWVSSYDEKLGMMLATSLVLGLAVLAPKIGPELAKLARKG